MGFVLIFTNSCKKDDNNSTSNSTNGKTNAIFNFELTYGTMTDQDGNTYKTIKIGTQTWMAENLRTTKYRNGGAIPQVTDNTTWGNLSTGAYCNYKNTKNNDTIATFGRLYNWFTISDSRNIAPTGWHVPSDDEWKTLINYLGGENIASGKLKETDITHWNSPNTGATNESGYTALPGGGRYDDGSYDFIGYNGNWWSSSEDGTDFACYRCLYCLDNYVYSHSLYYKVDGFSVRCLMDN
jgi:uncharacterized protein (TIGR02145 family)